MTAKDSAPAYMKTMRLTPNYLLRQFETKKVAVYARVSRETEVKHQSIESQKANLASYIIKHPDWEFIGFYVDEGVTGTKMNRPEFSRMVEDAKAGKLDIIVTKSVSRFGRNTSGVLKLLQELKMLDVAVIFDNENINTANENDLIRLQYLSIMAEKEAKQTSDNQKWSYQKRFKEGIPNHARLYGYKMVDHQLKVIPEEAEVVKRIFAMYLSGMGIQAICRVLNNEGIPSLTGSLWKSTTIYNILRNEKYAGDMLMQKWYVPDFITKTSKLNRGELPQYLMQEAHEAIINRNTYEKVQNEILIRSKKQNHSKPSSKSEPRLMSQLVRCKHCDKSIYYRQSNGDSKRKLWMCKTHVELGNDYCPVKSIREDILINATRDVLLQENLIKENTPLTNELLKSHIQIILAKENYELEYHLKNGNIVIKSCKCPSRSKSWTPEMKQKARERALAQHAKRKEENHEQ